MCVCVCVWRRQTVSLFACMCVYLYSYVLVCLRVWGTASRGNLPISWPTSIYMKTNYSWGCGKFLVPERKTKEMQRNVSQWNGRIEPMSAEMRHSGLSEGPVCFDKSNSFLWDKSLASAYEDPILLGETTVWNWNSWNSVCNYLYFIHKSFAANEQRLHKFDGWEEFKADSKEANNVLKRGLPSTSGCKKWHSVWLSP